MFLTCDSPDATDDADATRKFLRRLIPLGGRSAHSGAGRPSPGGTGPPRQTCWRRRLDERGRTRYARLGALCMPGDGAPTVVLCPSPSPHSPSSAPTPCSPERCPLRLVLDAHLNLHLVPHPHPHLVLVLPVLPVLLFVRSRAPTHCASTNAARAAGARGSADQRQDTRLHQLHT